MKIAIHHNNWGFSSEWIKYFEEKGLEYKIVNAYDNDIISQLLDCDILMWHHHHGEIKDVLAAKLILQSLEHAGKKVFPNFKTAWHFDDKVAQKYLLEAINAPLVPSFVFYNKKEAIEWAENSDYPKVFKLRGGASASNVKLVKNKKECIKLINQAFGRGFSQFSKRHYFQEQLRKFKQERNIKLLLKAVGRLFLLPEFARMRGREKGYVYFQKFIPNNKYDIRLIIIDGKYAYGMKRMNRKNDFRASGSSNFVFDEIPDQVLLIAFETAKKLGLQTVAFDFVFDEGNRPLIVEMSYGFGTMGSSQCRGFWTEDLNWHEGKFFPERWMVDALIK